MKSASAVKALPDGIIFKGAAIDRTDGGWTNSRSLGGPKKVYESLIEAIASMYAGRFTMGDMAQDFGSSKNLTLGQVYGENPAAVTGFVRRSWIENFTLYYPRGLARTGRKPTSPLEEQITALRELLGQLSSSGAIELYVVVNEALQQYLLLVELPEESWKE